ncbi:hypothetical protein BCR44DRAFT_1498355 [Catenaria anguillulae PL171]|uniref:HTH myb-type domain-containing protein n=1 Tax=Catenaria anguillulae PL171 TaxID=765915 RepID=A0A1Y2HR51_9FUNG|nr:hypothetical protein BCR44DRAFT_1498355 [Catenaria anguillulae PL171]
MGGGLVYGAMTAAGARALEHEKLYQSIRQKRRLRERQRASRLAAAPNERERHRIRREWNEAEVAIREQERQELAGVRAVNGAATAGAGSGTRSSRSTGQGHGDADDQEEEEEVMRASDEDDDGVDQERMLPSDDDDDPDDPNSHGASGAMGPSIQFIDGKAVITRPSALIVRSGARGGRGTPQPTHVVEESAAHGRYYNQATHTRGGANRSGARWRPDELELFYEGLRKFGTNFEAIAMTIPGKTRVNVRNKYHSEAKRDAEKIDEALSQFAPASLEEYSDATGMSTEEITQPVPQEVLDAAERAVRGETSGEEVLAATAAAQAAGVLLAAAAATTASANGQADGGEDEEGEGEGGDVMAMSDDEDEDGAAAMQMSDDDEDEEAGPGQQQPCN